MPCIIYDTCGALEGLIYELKQHIHRICVCVCVYVCVCVRACVRACIDMCMRVCVSAYMSACVCLPVYYSNDHAGHDD